MCGRITLEAVTDLFTFDSDEPELIVRVWQGGSGTGSWENVNKNKLQSDARGRRMQAVANKLTGTLLIPQAYFVCENFLVMVDDKC